MTKKNDAKPRFSFQNSKNIVFIISFAFVAVHLFATLYYYVTIGQFGDLKDMALFGDSFGALNAVFSGLAIAGVVYSLIIQGKELEATLEEMKDSTDAQRKSSEILDLQLKSIDRNNTIRILKQHFNDPDNFKYRHDKVYSQLIIDKLIEDIISDSRYDLVFRPTIKIRDGGQSFFTPPDAFYFTCGFDFNIPMEIEAFNVKNDSELSFSLISDGEKGNKINVSLNDKLFQMQIRSRKEFALIDFHLKPVKSGILWKQEMIVIVEQLEDATFNYDTSTVKFGSTTFNYRFLLGESYLLS